MAELTLNNKAIDKYFKYLKKLDNGSKKRLIIRLTETLEVEKSKSGDIKSLFGAWEGDSNSDEIIREIRESRAENKDVEKFE